MNHPLRPLSALLAVLLAPGVGAQVPGAAPHPAPNDGAGSLVYVGDSTRLGIGWDSENQLRGDLWQVFGEDDRSAWIGELWITRDTAGGGKLSYQWRPEGAAADAGVRKFFGAFDQNSTHDRKVTLGGGDETERWFASGYVSAGISGRRETAASTSSSTTTRLGEDNGRPYAQDVTTTVVTTTYERAYDWGIGGRAGRFYPGPLLRLEAGLDYEGGKNSTGQATASLSLEKYFAGTPHSLAFSGEIYHKHGGIETDRNDGRVWLMYRYALNSPAAWRPEKAYRMVEAPAATAPAAPAAPSTSAPAVAAAAVPATPAQPRTEKRIVKTTATANADAFFELDRATLQPAAKAALDTAIARIKASGFEGNLRITGHTCDLGPDAHNLRLSQRRANAVRDYLVTQGLPAERLIAEGMGERAPRYANTPELRPKNRRVDLEFVTFEEKVETITLPAPPSTAPVAPAAQPAVPSAAVAKAATVEWRREEIASEPTWLRRALRNAPGHKQSVDVYQTQSDATTVTEGPKRYLNREPVARNDTATVEADATARPIDVLANDTDPDGDPIAITAVGTPAHGTATISGRQVLYAPTPGYLGADTFTYTIDDGKGGRSTASVAVSVVRANRAPNARDDFAIAGYNQPVSIDVLGNDSDPDGDPLVVVSFTQAQNGSVTRGPGNKLTYLSAPNYVGYDNFTYEVSDGKGGTSRATVVVFADP
jgi:outer membrane protein OmpA-like peptidoglycan-associated protein